jgi:hypothetical protein
MFPLTGSVNMSFNIINTGVASAFSNSDQPIINDMFFSGGLSATMPGITAALTHGALFASVGHGVSAANAVNFLNGSSSTLVPYVVVRWQWRTLPAVLNVLGIVFLAVTVYFIKETRLPIWNTSALAVVYHVLRDGIVSQERPYELASDMNVAAGSTYMALSQLQREATRLLLRSEEDSAEESASKSQQLSRKNKW